MCVLMKVFCLALLRCRAESMNDRYVWIIHMYAYTHIYEEIIEKETLKDEEDRKSRDKEETRDNRERDKRE